MNEYNLDEKHPQMSKAMLKKIIDHMNKEKYEEEIRKEVQTKSKTKHWAENISTPIGTRPQHMEKLTRKQCSAIIRTRSRMLAAKTNQKKTAQRGQSSMQMLCPARGNSGTCANTMTHTTTDQHQHGPPRRLHGSRPGPTQSNGHTHHDDGTKDGRTNIETIRGEKKKIRKIVLVPSQKSMQKRE